jgi:hypothetical protein
MTGRASVGNPLLAAAVLLVIRERSAWAVLLTIGGSALGAANRFGVARLLFPQG